MNTIIMAITKWRTMLIAIVALLGGCVSVPRDSGFGDVQQSIDSRTGQRVQWNRLSADARAVEASLRELLAQPLTANRAVQIALLNNRNLQATYEDLGVAQAELVQAGLLRNPVFDIEAKFLESAGGTIVEFAVVQDFLDVFFIPLRKRIAGDAFEIAKLHVTGAAMDLMSEVRAAYVEHAAAEQTLELRRTVVESTWASYELARRINAAGNNTTLALANERALYEQSKLDLATAESHVLDTRERLNVLLGLWGTNTSWTIADRLTDPSVEMITTDDIERRAVASNIELAIARRSLESSARSFGLTRSTAWLADAEIGIAGEREPDDTWAFGPSLSAQIPVFDQGQARTASAQAQFERARQQYIASAVEVRSAARSARNRLNAARARAEYIRQVMLPLRQQITRETQLQYNAMQVGAFQLLSAKQDEIETGVAYVDALREYWLARNALQQTIAGRASTPEMSRPARTASNQRESQGH